MRLVPQLLSAHCTSHCGAHDDQDHDECHEQEGAHFHSEDDSGRSIVVGEAILGVLVGMLADDGILVGGRVDVVVVFKSMCRSDFGSVVILVEGGEALRLMLQAVC